MYDVLPLSGSFLKNSLILGTVLWKATFAYAFSVVPIIISLLEAKRGFPKLCNVFHKQSIRMKERFRKTSRNALFSWQRNVLKAMWSCDIREIPFSVTYLCTTILETFHPATTWRYTLQQLGFSDASVPSIPQTFKPPSQRIFFLFPLNNGTLSYDDFRMHIALCLLYKVAKF